MKIQVSSYEKIEWKKPAQGFRTEGLATAVGAPSDAVPDSLQLAVERFGEPSARQNTDVDVLGFSRINPVIETLLGSN